MKLVNLIPLREMDFRNQAAFDSYQKQHTLRPDTKVTIAGKTTTAGQASQSSEPVKGTSVFGGDSPKVDGMATVNSIAAKTGMRAQAVAGWADENGVNLSKVSADIDSKKLNPKDFMTAVVGNPGNKYAKDIIFKYSQSSSPKSDMGVDSVVYNKRTNTVGIVRMADERGEIKTDADGNVNTDELEPFNPMKYPHQKNAQVAPSTKKEIDTRGLWKPFSQSANEPKKINNPTEALPKEIYAKMDNEDSDAGEMDYLSSKDGSIKYGIAKEGDKYYVTLGTEEGEILKSFGKTKNAEEAAQMFMKNLDVVKSKYKLDV